MQDVLSMIKKINRSQDGDLARNIIPLSEKRERLSSLKDLAREDAEVKKLLKDLTKTLFTWRDQLLRDLDKIEQDMQQIEEHNNACRAYAKQTSLAPRASKKSTRNGEHE